MTEPMSVSKLLTNCAPKLSWYALHVRSNFERIVHRTLQSKGYELFLPLYRSQRRWSDRIKQIDVPLFPGYVFCRLDPRDRLQVLMAPGVLQIVGQGRIPTALAEEEVVAVQTALQSNLPCLPWPSLAPGQHVLVESGPLMGVQGILLETRYPSRLVISIQMLQRAVAVEIDANWVRPCNIGVFPQNDHLELNLRA
jgi:transcription antitermination factor NusG